MTDFWDSPDVGLKDDFDGTISPETRWEQYEGGNYSLRLSVNADDGSLVFIGGLGAGKNWQSVDGGESIQPLAKPKFHEKTGIWKWISACAKAGAADTLKSANEKLGGGPTRFYAASFNGLRFHFDVVDEPGGIRQDDGTFKDGLRQVIRPTAYLGAAVPVANTNGNGGSITPADLATLKIIARASDSYGDFADAVMDSTGENGEKLGRNKAVLVALADQSWYESLRS